ncbi:N-Acetylneuraminate cytidylyltransferase [Paramagnetospirillum magnetotacticum MS-1]|uniref:N-Acetylneuraminate cytidylyltransferase n=1 Tax=Paramagnetospirillum magnetotacticum MS-1 TaxID=272627 RepID=A0A0C2YHH7_PARME|nr:GNAT family N-acetyltransferase [Paramagnetospirillum magnetotacticum]KIL99154.1 N-Acetylneuraminate cytidylyltransferase [Paramagnetospirillum magnetotacticum MS-1]
MEFRKAVGEDAPDLLVWRNDPDTIASSLTGKGVAPADHFAWIARVLASPDYILLMAEQAGEKLGMVRFDRDDEGEWEVSINLNPAARGRGLAACVLAGAIAAAFPGQGRPTLVAWVKRSNPASWRIFQRCGFAHQGDEDGVGYFRLAPSCGVGGRMP